MKAVATLFGQSLDMDDFDTVQTLLSEDCQYLIGEEILIGPAAIANSYQQNMIEGKKKLDKLEWGESRIDPINAFEFYVHFTDYLTHKGMRYTHCCKQQLVLNTAKKIIQIIHIEEPEVTENLNNFYRRVGILPAR